MNMIAVDDERPALCMLEEAIKEAAPGATITCFLRAEEALEYAKKNRVDVAFLDIQMAGITGLALAKSLKDIYGKTNILFVTGHEEHALDAISMAASGYIVKPAESERIALELGRLRDPVQEKDSGRVRIQCFGSFTVFVDGEPLMFSRSKAQELLALLVHKHGAGVSNGEIAAVLWEDKPYDASLQSQTRKARAHLLQILKNAGVEDIIHKGFNNIAIDPEKVSCDFYESLKGNVTAINTYTGEYMNQYSWAEFMAAYLDRRIK